MNVYTSLLLVALLVQIGVVVAAAADCPDVGNCLKDCLVGSSDNPSLKSKDPVDPFACILGDEEPFYVCVCNGQGTYNEDFCYNNPDCYYCRDGKPTGSERKRPESARGTRKPAVTNVNTSAEAAATGPETKPGGPGRSQVPVKAQNRRRSHGGRPGNQQLGGVPGNGQMGGAQERPAPVCFSPPCN